VSAAAKLKDSDIIIIRRCLAVICYAAMLAADGCIAYIIYLSYYGGMTYYLGQAIFVPVFIVSYWFSTFFSQLTFGRQGGRRIIPKWLGAVLNGLATLVSAAFLAFWGYIYYNQLMYTPENEKALAQTHLCLQAAQIMLT
jgi:hypothetical protein